MTSSRSVIHNGGRLVARATSRIRLLPSFLVIGTKRGGSSSLYDYVTRHPDVLPAVVSKGSHYFDVHYGRGWSWYRSTFPLALPGRRGVITGEASPYYMFHPLAAERIAAALPEVRLIAALRDPVTRAWSQHQYETRRGHEHLPFEDALAREPERLAGQVERILAGEESFAHRHHSYLARGRYAEQLERIYELIPPERVLVLRSEAMFADPAGTLSRVWRFLGLDDYRLDQAPVLKPNRYDRAMPEAARAFLEDYYHPHNERLYRLPGIDFRFEAEVEAPAPRPAVAPLASLPSRPA